MQAMKQKSQSHHQPARDSDDEENDGNHEDVGYDVVDERWKKQRYTSNQLRKKLDAVSGGVTASWVPVGPAFVLFYSMVHVSFLQFTLPSILPSTGHETNIAQPKTDKYLSSPSHFSSTQNRQVS